MKRKLLLAGVIASFLALASSLNGPANAQIGIGGRNALSNPVVSGVLSLADGTLALPSLTNTGDTDTGLRFPAANSIGFSLGGKDLGEWYVATGTLSATQVRKLSAAPVEVIAAPSSGKSIVVESVQWHLDWDSNIYDSIGANEDLTLIYTTDGSRAQVGDCDASAACLDPASTADDHALVRAYGIADVASELHNAQSISAKILTGEWASTDDDTDGDSPIRYLIRYRIVTLNLS